MSEMYMRVLEWLVRDRKFLQTNDRSRERRLSPRVSLYELTANPKLNENNRRRLGGSDSRLIFAVLENPLIAAFDRKIETSIDELFGSCGSNSSSALKLLGLTTEPERCVCHGGQNFGAIDGKILQFLGRKTGAINGVTHSLVLLPKSCLL